MSLQIKEIETPAGLARAHVERVRDARGSVVVSHGAGGGIEAPDLVALRVLVDHGWNYVRVEQPWRVAGRKVATPPKTLDAAWVPIIESLTTGRGRLVGPLVVGGRSAGARVACRTAADVGADAVLALSFPLSGAGKTDRARAPELRLPLDAGLPVLVVQGATDPFGRPADFEEEFGTGVDLVVCKGAHSFSQNPTDVVEAVRVWLRGLDSAPSQVVEPQLPGASKHLE